ncbi:MAG TPA: undecaprenyl-diphosphate phosphatase [Dissulfurispiraceae bacterium]|nr:undecaprenyl-diphosphate phosphatase [Dissulfurispiraceae bacterium]
MTITDTFILGVIEGLTEFLPVSSTGHMILASAVMGIGEEEFVKTFEIAIQLGAILSVVILYYRRFLVSAEIYLKLAVGFIPTGVIGLLAYKTIKHYLFNPYVVSASLIAGGILLIALDQWTKGRKSRYSMPEKVSFVGAALVGLVQCLAMIPGVSRAAAAIFGGLLAGLDRKQATEFSFLLAVPTMFAATGYDLLKTSSGFNSSYWILLLIGGLVAFFSALIAVKAFIYLVPRYGFKHFGYYRIALGAIFLAYSVTSGLTL